MEGNYRREWDRKTQTWKHIPVPEIKGGQLPSRPQPICKDCGHDEKLHDEETRICTKEDCICPKYKYDLGAALLPSLVGLGVTGMLGNMMLGGMKKMLGMGSGDVEINAKDVMFVMIDGFMGYYQEKEREIEELKDKLAKMEDELEQKKTHYDEAMASAQKNFDMAKEWQRKYMKLVSKSRKPRKQ